MKQYILSLFLCLSIYPLKAQTFYTIIDDDATSVNAISEIKRIADKKNIKITFAVIAATVSSNNELCDSLLSFQEQGFHICNHSLTHRGNIWNNQDFSAIEKEMTRSSRLLDSLGFLSHNYLVYPFGKFSQKKMEHLLPIVQKDFRLAFNSRGGTCNFLDFNRHYINRFPLRKHENISVVKYKIDKAIEQGEWIVFFTHSNMSRDFSPEYLEKVISYCQYKNLPCLTVDEAYCQLTPYKGDAKIKEWSMWNEILLQIEMHIWYLLTAFIILLSGILFIYFKKKRCYTQ